MGNQKCNSHGKVHSARIFWSSVPFSSQIPMPLGSAWARFWGKPSVAKTTARNLIGFASWIPVVACFNLYVAELSVVDGPSMYPLLNDGRDTTLRRDVVLNYKWAPQDNLKRGMIVALRSPTHPDTIAIKRVVAVEHDVIKTKAPYPVRTVKIPENHVWIEGDGPPGSSLDSNTYGPVSKRLLTGKITHIVYPFRKFGPVKWWEHERPLVT
ncbi:LexA/Signal peptidase [Paramyrothecium foliicola]|nr:LexA/Signal peptidase [Paramyrothecium foliicola]